jgi:hypothetical protein
VNVSFAAEGATAHLGRPAAHLHVPTGRVPFELVVWHVLGEWDVASKARNWQTVLETSIAGFHERRTAS